MATSADFIIIADALADCRPVAGPGTTPLELKAMQAQHNWTINVLAARLKATNPRFNAVAFRSVCDGKA